MPGPAAPSPAQARLVAFAILFGAACFAVVVPILLQANDGKGYSDPPVPMLDWIATGSAVALAIAATLMRGRILGQAGTDGGPTRALAHFQATLVVLALLEGGMLFCCIAWLLNGNAVPNAAAAGALFVLAILLLPRQPQD